MKPQRELCEQIDGSVTDIDGSIPDLTNAINIQRLQDTDGIWFSVYTMPADGWLQ